MQTIFNIAEVALSIHMHVRIAKAGIEEVYSMANKDITGYYMLLFIYSSQGPPLHN